jgi:hypothetical protein
MLDKKGFGGSIRFATLFDHLLSIYDLPTPLWLMYFQAYLLESARWQFK